MIVAIHALTGAALGRFCKSRPQALLAGAISHLIADMLPHRDLEIFEESLLLAGAFTVVAAARGSDSIEFAGAFGAALPDLENLVGRALKVPDARLLLPTHSRRHGPEAPNLRGQLLLALGCLTLLAFPSPSRCAGSPGRGNSSR